MHPAYSVIFFTVASGAGYGLLMVFALTAAAGHWTPTSTHWASGLVALGLSTTLVVAGLMSSTFHLGHPERAWRALSQWKTSWLSREGLFAVITFVPIVLLAVLWLMKSDHSIALKSIALLVALGSLLTVASTAMIYASLKTIPRWNDVWVMPVYLTFSVSAGLLVCSSILIATGAVLKPLLMSSSAFIVIAWACKLAYWRSIDNSKPISTAEGATGLGKFGKVHVLEAPHTSENYVQKEMGFSIARKHSQKLRRYAMILGLVLPLIFIVLTVALDSPLQFFCIFFAVVSTFIAHLLERWLFFAEAQHVVTLFYGNTKV